MSQQHSFITFIKNKHNFELTIFGLNVTASWRINFRQYFRMLVLSPIVTLRLFINNKIPKTKISVNNSLIKFNLNCILNLKIKNPVFSFIMKQLLNITNMIKIPKMLMTISLKIIYKLDPTNITIPRIRFAATPTMGKFYQLWEHDGKTLAAMDSQALKDLDSIIY